MLYFPDRECWSTFTVHDCPDLDYCGGHAVISKGRNQSPLSVTYGWHEDRYMYEIAVIPTASLISISEEPTEVAHAKDEQEAVNNANNATEGVADIIADISQSNFGLGSVVVLSAGAIPAVQLDQHEEAIAWLTRKVRELVQ